MIIDCDEDHSLWPKKIPLTKEEAENISKLESGDVYNFGGEDFVFVGKSEKRAEWTSLS